jgi:hypothetical protein
VGSAARAYGNCERNELFSIEVCVLLDVMFPNLLSARVSLGCGMWDGMTSLLGISLIRRRCRAQEAGN